MSWNYRVCKKRYKKFDPEVHDPEDEFSFGIYSVHYNGKGNICFTSIDPADPFGLTQEELKADFDLMAGAFDKPLLDLDQIDYDSPDV